MRKEGRKGAGRDRGREGGMSDRKSIVTHVRI